MLLFFENDVLQHEGVVVSLVPGRIDEGDRALARTTAQVLQYFWMPGELRAVAAAKLVPAFRVMAEPCAQLRARRDLLDPLVELRFGLADAARPQVIDQDPCAVRPFGRIISALEPDVRSGGRAVDDSGDLR